jgi:hypothetical protein
MININFQTDDNQINDFLVVCDKFNQRPNRLVLHETYSGLDFQESINSCENLYQNHFTEMIPSDDDYIYNQRILRQISEDIFISYLEIDRNNQDFIISEVIFYYKNIDNFESVQKLISDFSECIVDFSSTDNHKINYLSVKEGALSLEPLIFDTQENIELFYNTDTFKKVEKLVKKIKKNSTGISILHGDIGNGKSQLSKWICKSVDEICIYIPLNLIEQSINNPEFKNFLKKWGKVLLVIDDCDFLFNPIFGKTNYFAQNILQLVDGMFTDICQIHSLLIFNTYDREEIDEYLVDSNCTLDIIEIDELDQEQANELSEHLNIKKRYKTSAKVIEVVLGQKKTQNIKIGLD